eukprot:INCI5900.3.p1 GENE.INCI5900.3~~INCI5900.3.p1  ORF type:complete len:548 (+),score=91.25 INCI5900.3:377-2020(+)
MVKPSANRATMWQDTSKKKPADIGPECHFFSRHGYCPQGFCCRFGDSHIDVSDPAHPRLIELTTAQRIDDMDVATNTVSSELLLAIRNATKALKRAKREAEDAARDAAGEKEGNRKRNRRKKKNAGAKLPDHLQLCRQFSKGVCTYGEKCRWSHDPEAAQQAVAEAAAAAAAAAAEAAAASTESVNFSDSQDPTVQFSKHMRTQLEGAGHVPKPRPKVDFRGKVYVAPLTTVGNLPFRRIVKRFGADITCGEMVLATSLLAGNMNEWALLRRHPSEDVFGVQIAGHHSDHLGQCCALLDSMNVDFVDLNMGCPIDLVVGSGAGSACMRPNGRGKMGGALRRFERTVLRMHEFLPHTLLTLKMRTGWFDAKDKWSATSFVKTAQRLECVDLVTVHGRSREGRYYTTPDWDYLDSCVTAQTHDHPRIPVFGNGDVYNWDDWVNHLHVEDEANEKAKEAAELLERAEQREAANNSQSNDTRLSGCMLGRGALIKPWVGFDFAGFPCRCHTWPFCCFNHAEHRRMFAACSCALKLRSGSIGTYLPQNVWIS